MVGAGRAALAILIILGASAAWAGSPVNTGYFGNVAIMGYDPVAYFTDGRAVKGSEQFAYKWLGATWHFANTEHQQTFVTPIRYALQYGGLCALPLMVRGRSTSILRLGASSTASSACSSAQAGWSRTGIRIPRPWWRRLTPTGRRSRPNSPRDESPFAASLTPASLAHCERKPLDLVPVQVYSSCLSGVPVGLR